LTSQGAVEGGLSWLVGATLDFSFARDLCASAYGARGGKCYDPASLLFLETATKVDGYPDYASFCRDLEQAEKGCCYRDLAGPDEAIPGEDSFSHFRKRVGHAVVDQTMDIMVQLFIDAPCCDVARELLGTGVRHREMQGLLCRSKSLHDALVVKYGCGGTNAANQTDMHGFELLMAPVSKSVKTAR
jgi:hypothetical protein